MKKVDCKNHNKSFSWMNPKLVVKDTKKYGKGVFAFKNIKKGETLSVFGGYIRTIEEEEKLPKEFNDNGVQISDDFVITLLERSELEDASYFNHSCEPNAGFKGQIFLVAMKNIKRGEQVTFDYAMAISNLRGHRNYKFKCFCRSEKCRKVITNNDWKNEVIQNKYNGYFQFYLQEIINKK